MRGRSLLFWSTIKLTVGIAGMLIYFYFVDSPLSDFLLRAFGAALAWALGITLFALPFVIWLVRREAKEEKEREESEVEHD